MPVNFKLHEPKTLTEAVQALKHDLRSDEVSEIRRADMSAYHHGIGMTLRNSWGLWTGSPLKSWFMETHGLGHADDMSGMILEALQADLRCEPFDAAARAASYHEFWRKQGIDPLTQEKLP